MPLTEKDLAARRHSEVIESLWRIGVALEAIHQLLERHLSASAALNARTEAALQYAVKAWQQTRPERAP